jgi:hypothetical protein
MEVAIRRVGEVGALVTGCAVGVSDGLGVGLQSVWLSVVGA